MPLCDTYDIVGQMSFEYQMIEIIDGFIVLKNFLPLIFRFVLNNVFDESRVYEKWPLYPYRGTVMTDMPHPFQISLVKLHWVVVAIGV